VQYQPANTYISNASKIGRNSKEIRFPEIEACAKELKSTHKKVGAIGYCYGGWACFQLGGKGKSLVDAISVAHPSLLTKEEIDNVAVPVQILAPETDGMYTPELKVLRTPRQRLEYSNVCADNVEKEHTLKVLPERNIEFDYQYFPGLAHGFAAK